ncbi:hypothetical protein CMI38_05150 [Candidatus Pacearchaeota archaeon]|jgi:hypothetical protein|nr:hypothetical protein [Candidatus Pacearchaeota archaeon]|tara:strand:+ start:561 stop:779 length:219 start_codon:yes stop_codon:yes gene_type:complete
MGYSERFERVMEGLAELSRSGNYEASMVARPHLRYLTHHTAKGYMHESGGNRVDLDPLERFISNCLSTSVSE